MIVVFGYEVKQVYDLHGGIQAGVKRGFEAVFSRWRGLVGCAAHGLVCDYVFSFLYMRRALR